MEEQNKPKKRGGYRENGGRPSKSKAGSQLVSFRMNKEHYDIIKEYFPSLTEFVDKAIKEKLRREGLV